MRTNNYKKKVATLIEVKQYIDDYLDDLIQGKSACLTGKDIADHFDIPYSITLVLSKN